MKAIIKENGEEGLEIESIDIAKAVAVSNELKGAKAFYMANALRYLKRSEKNGLEDLKKARVYMDWLIESLEPDINDFVMTLKINIDQLIESKERELDHTALIVEECRW